jgi:hypothetical protein
MKHLEDYFNLPEDNETEPLLDDGVIPVTQVPTAVQLKDALSVSEKIAIALKEVQGLDHLDSEMNEISRMALEKFQELSKYGMSVPEQHAGPILSEATKMLQIALAASDTKVKRKLEQVDLMLKQRRLDVQEERNKGTDDDDNDSPTSGFKISRNELLGIIKNEKKDG